ncbi:MAG: uridine kinase [Acidobacteria bacterium]|nr:uridine kinase [Acidobacteriota bacterium]
MTRPHLIAIAGASGSGKTTLAQCLAAALGPPDATLLPLDAYYRDHPEATAAELDTANYDAPEAVDAALLEAQVRQLRAGRAVERPTYDFRTHRRTTATWTVRPGRYVIVEGILALHWSTLRNLYDTSVFLRIDVATALARRLARDCESRGRSPASVRRQWEETVWPMYRRHVEPTARFADVIVDGAAPIASSLAAVLAHVRARESRSPRTGRQPG